MAVERKLLVREGERQREVLLVGTVTVGRSPLCEISGVDPRLSREHAAFEVVGADVVVRDLGSRNGTLVNGAAVTSHRLIAGDVVEVGPFTVELTESAGSAAGRPAAPRAGNEDATVLRPIRAERPAGASHPVPAAAAAPTASAAAAESTPPRMAAPARPVPAGDEPTVRRPRPSMPAAPGSAPAPSVRPQPVPAPPPSPALPGAPVLAPPRAATPPAALSELSYGRAALLWVVPVALVAFLAGLVPALLAPDERGPLLEAHYGALATSAAELTKLASEPAMPLDAITAALRRHAGVTSVRILGADGRVHAPMNEAGTKLEVPALSGATPHVDTAASGQVAIHVAATTRDGRPLIVALAVDPSAVAPAPSGSALGTLLLFASLGLAWLVARRLTRITDGRLSRLGEEV
jgi:predicted component of type VI protein secretion system